MNRKNYIMNNLKDKYNYLLKNNYKVIALFLQGSQNYNLDIYDNEYKSDIDVKAIVLPTIQDIILNRTPISTTIVLDNNEHIEVKDIRIMKDMFIKQNISYIELLYTNYYVINPKYFDYINELLNMWDKIANINRNQFLRCIKGMSMEKKKALEHPYPSLIDKIEKYGYDPKQLHHIVRLNEFARRLLIDKESLDKCYISKNHDSLISLKKGLCSLDEARELANSYDLDTKYICDSYMYLEDKVNHNYINLLNDWVTKVLKYSLKKELLEEVENEEII